MAALSSMVLTAIAASDHRLMRRLNGWRAPRWLRVWMIAATRGGDGWLWYAVGFVILAFGGDMRFQALGAALLASGTGVGLFVKLKRLCGRKRPCALAPHAWSTLLPPDQFSFPSGHTITAFSVSVSLGGFYPEIQPGLYFCAVSVAASRILLGMHFLSDVVAGGAIGVILARTAITIFS